MYENAYDFMRQIDERELLRIHVKAASKGKIHRGTGIRNRPRFLQSIKDLHNAADAERDLLDIIVGIFDDIERNPQPFNDCNHRTAMALGRILAKQFGFRLSYSEKEGERLRARWEEMSRDDLKVWVRRHL